MAAVLAYGSHHLSALGDHEVPAIIVAIGSATLVAMLAGRLVIRRPHTAVGVLLADAGEAVLSEGTSTHLSDTAELHAEALPHGFFVELGPSFLRAYHSTFANSPHAVLVVATIRDQVVGFVAGPLDPAAHARWTMRTMGLRLAVTGAFALLLRPRTAWRFARTRVRRYAMAWSRHRSGEDQSVVRGPQEPMALLSHVAVDGGARGAGLGALLVKDFVDRAGGRTVRLVTHEGDRGASGFYRGLGWHDAGTLTAADGDVFREFAWRSGG